MKPTRISQALAVLEYLLGKDSVPPSQMRLMLVIANNQAPMTVAEVEYAVSRTNQHATLVKCVAENLLRKIAGTNPQEYELTECGVTEVQRVLRGSDEYKPAPVVDMVKVNRFVLGV